jgi:hypothetical protein
MKPGTRPPCGTLAVVCFTFVCPAELEALARLRKRLRGRRRNADCGKHGQLRQPQGVVRVAPAAVPGALPGTRGHTNRLSSAFEVLSTDGSALRGTFVIDPDGVLRHASVTDMNVGRSPR